MTKFRFRYDSVGTKLDVPPPASAPVGKMSRRRAAEAPRSASASERPAYEVVLELKTWIEKHPDFGLDMNLLEERSILITPPNWSYVVEVAGSPRAANSTTDEWLSVEKYVQMLGDRQGAIDRALQTAAWTIGSLSKDPVPSFRDALRALPKGGQVDPPVLLEPIQSLLKKRKAAEWADAIHSHCDEIKRSVTPLDLNDVVSIGWRHWQDRLSAYRSHPQDFEVNANDLLLRTRGVGPAALLRNDLTNMTIREWTAALLASLQLDFPSKLIQLLIQEISESELLRGHRTALVIVGASVTSSTALWLPSRRNASLWIERAQIESLGLLPASALDRQCIIAFEIAGSVDTIDQVRAEPREMTLIAPWLSKAKPTYVYLGADRLPPNTTPKLPYIENPKDVDDAIAKVRELTRDTPSSPPPP